MAKVEGGRADNIAMSVAAQLQRHHRRPCRDRGTRVNPTLAPLHTSSCELQMPAQERRPGYCGESTLLIGGGGVDARLENRSFAASSISHWLTAAITHLGSGNSSSRRLFPTGMQEPQLTQQYGLNNSTRAISMTFSRYVGLLAARRCFTLQSLADNMSACCTFSSHMEICSKLPLNAGYAIMPRGRNVKDPFARTKASA